MFKFNAAVMGFSLEGHAWMFEVSCLKVAFSSIVAQVTSDLQKLEISQLREGVPAQRHVIQQVLDAFDNIVTNVAHRNRLNEECDFLALRSDSHVLRSLTSCANHQLA
eukprot:6468302-Amphidinium_carterae.3